MMLLRLLLCAAAACLCPLSANAQGYDHDWAIEPKGDIIVQGVDDDIIFTYSVPVLHEGKECSVIMFEEDCITVGGSSVYLDMVDTTSVERELTSHFRINTDTITSSRYYTHLDPYRGRISFCTRVDCTLNGESNNFHETQLQIDFDWTVGFAIDAELASSHSKYKELDSYTLSFYPTDGTLGDDSLRVIEVAAALFLEAEMNSRFRDSNNPVKVYATILGQKMITRQEEERLRFLRARNVSRSLTEHDTMTGTELGVGLEALFDHEPAPSTDACNEAQEYALVENADLFVGNLSAIISVCDSELGDVSEAEMEYAKSLYQNGQLTNSSLVNSTIAAGLANLTYEELLFAEAAMDACGNITELGNITEMLEPARQGGRNSRLTGSLSLGHPVDAFFCDVSSNPVPDPVISQGGTIRLCVRLSQDSAYFHLEDIYTLALTQPTTGVTTHYAVKNGNPSTVTTKNCQLGLCNIRCLVPSRFFYRDSDQVFDQDPGPVRIVGVAQLNVGPQDRRVLAPIEFSGHRQLLTGDTSRSAFELEANLIGSLEQQGWAPTHNSNENSAIGNACVLALATTTIFVVLLVLWWRRKQKASLTPMPMQPTPNMEVQAPERIVDDNSDVDENSTATVLVKKLAWIDVAPVSTVVSTCG